MSTNRLGDDIVQTSMAVSADATALDVVVACRAGAQQGIDFTAPVIADAIWQMVSSSIWAESIAR